MLETYFQDVKVNNSQTCPEESQFWNNQTPLIWPETHKGELAVSSPLCIGESLTITYRLCEDDGWEEAPACQNIQTTSLNPCPADLRATGNGLYCYTVLDSTTFPPACPYPGVVSWDEYAGLDILPDKPVWMPVTRNDSLQYGLDIFRFIEPTHKYKTPFQICTQSCKTLFYNETFLDKPCLIHHNSSHVEAVSCDVEYAALCVYPTLHRQNDSLCSQLHATYCKQGNYNPTDLCYCKSNNSAIGNEVLAEFLEPHQNLLFQNVSCRFGLSNTYGVNAFQWVVSHTPLTYTYWARDVDFGNSTGVLTDQGWRLLNDSFECSIYRLTDLSLNEDVWLDFDIHDDSWFSLEVVQYRQFLYQEGKPLIFCFTDSDASSVLYRLSDFSSTTTDSNYKITFSALNLDESGPGNYWCEAFSYPNFSVVRSANQITPYSGEYVVLLALPHYNKKLGNYPLTSENLETVQNLFRNELPSDCSFYPRVYKINGIDEQRKSMNITFHLTSAKAGNTEQEFDVLKNISQSQSVFDFVDFRSVHYCPSSITIQRGAKVVWGRGNLGETHHPVNGYCVTPAGDLVQRSCKGNFIDGAYWDVVAPDCTLYPNSSLTSTIVNLLDLNQLKVISQSYQQFNTLDFVLTVKLINQLTDVGDIAEIISNLVQIHQLTLRSAQLNFKSTDLLIQSVELILDKSKFGEWNQPNFSVKIVNISEGIVGFNLDQYNNITTVSNATAYSFNQTDLYAAVRLSPILYQQIISHSTENTTYTPKMVLTIYYGSQLFVDGHKSADLVLGVSLPDFQATFQGPVTIYYFQTTEKHQNCSFWKFRNGTSGAWIMNDTEEFENAVACQYYHLTNFALTMPDQLDCSSGSYDSTELLNTVVMHKLVENDNMHLPTKGTETNYKQLPVLDGKCCNQRNTTKTSINCQLTHKLTVDVYNTPDMFVGLPTLQTLDDLADLIEQVFRSSEVHQGVLDSFDKLLESFTGTQLVVRDRVMLVTASKQDSIYFKGIRVSGREVSCLTEETLNPPGDVTVLFTHKLRQQIKNRKSRILIAIFYDDCLFPGSGTVWKPVVEVLMPELHQSSLDGEIVVQYDNLEGGGCSYWNGMDWIVESRAFHGGCRFNHVTHFALVVDAQNITNDLEQILESNLTSLEKLQQVNSILTVNHSNLLPFDIFLISRILTVSLNGGFGMISRIVSALFQVPQAILSESQRKHSATDLILYAVDQMSRMVTRIEEHHSNFSLIVRSLDNLTGIILYNCQNYSCSFEFLERAINVTDYSLNGSVTAMVVLNQSLLEQIRRSTPNPRIAISVYYTNVLFNEIHAQRATTKIFGVIFPNFNETNLEGNVTVVNKITARTSTSNQCAYWMYSPDPAGLNSTLGKWMNESKNQRDHSMAICSYSHVTHFGMLLSNADYLDDDPILDFITDVGCVLSLFGILVILITAMFFKRWRQNTGNQILIHFSLAISLTIITLYTSVYVKQISYGVWCTVTGSILHYAILSECGWMLTVAILQFKRFVEVLGGPPKYVLIKALICGWVFPLIPVLCVVLLDPHNYEKGLANLCYPSNLGLYLGVWLPVLLILTTNLIIFVIIMYNIFHKKTEYIDTSNQEILFQWRLALLLFFMLGLNMIFGFLAQIKDDKVFVYLYSITASMQGFVLFLFFILFNKSTRLLYSQSVKQWFYTKGIFRVKQSKKDNT